VYEIRISKLRRAEVSKSNPRKTFALIERFFLLRKKMKEKFLEQFQEILEAQKYQY
jgi:hypothetical protein